jgi:hypothetical protein
VYERYFSCGKMKVCDELKDEEIRGKVRRYIAGSRPQATLPRSQSTRLPRRVAKAKATIRQQCNTRSRCSHIELIRMDWNMKTAGKWWKVRPRA